MTVPSTSSSISTSEAGQEESHVVLPSNRCNSTGQDIPRGDPPHVNRCCVDPSGGADPSSKVTFAPSFYT